MNIKEKWNKWKNEADWNYLIPIYTILAISILLMIWISSKL